MPPSPTGSSSRRGRAANREDNESRPLALSARRVSRGRRVGDRARDWDILPRPRTPSLAGVFHAVLALHTGEIPIKDIVAINPPPPAFHGSVALNGLFTTGNSETEQLGFTAHAVKRWLDDRFSLGGEYSYGRQKDQNTGVTSTTVDYGAGFMKYEHFFTEKFYGYAGFKIEHDGVAGLTYCTTTGPGAGYQWFESPPSTSRPKRGSPGSTKLFENTGSRDLAALRFFYSVDWTPVKPLKLYNTVEYLPNIADWGEYLLNIDAGARATVWEGLFGDFRIEYRYNSRPDPGRKTTDVGYILSAGWAF